MKKNTKLLSIIFPLILTAGFYGCNDKILETRSYIGNKPIYMTYDDMRTGIKSMPAEELKQTGKFYFYNNYVFVNEYLKGVHIIDNTDSSNPVNMQFINIPGNIDMAIKDNFL